VTEFYERVFESYSIQLLLNEVSGSFKLVTDQGTTYIFDEVPTPVFDESGLIISVQGIVGGSAVTFNFTETGVELVENSGASV
jgi:hypothetical protein